MLKLVLKIESLFSFYFSAAQNWIYKKYNSLIEIKVRNSMKGPKMQNLAALKK